MEAQSSYLALVLAPTQRKKIAHEYCCHCHHENAFSPSLPSRQLFRSFFFFFFHSSSCFPFLKENDLLHKCKSEYRTNSWHTSRIWNQLSRLTGSCIISLLQCSRQEVTLILQVSSLKVLIQLPKPITNPRSTDTSDADALVSWKMQSAA